MIYYAHSMRKYGTAEEEKELQKIKELFPNHEVINPSNFPPGKGRKVMKPYFELIDECDFVVFSEFKGFIGRGVYREINYAKKNNKKSILLRNGKALEIEGLIINDENDWAINFAKIKEKQWYV